MIGEKCPICNRATYAASPYLQRCVIRGHNEIANAIYRLARDEDLPPDEIARLFHVVRVFKGYVKIKP